MSDNMIDYGGRKIAERPSLYSKEVADAVFDRIKEELAGICGYSMDDVEACRAQFIDAACVSGQDGYNMAKHLDFYHGWDCNREHVELFDDAPWNKVHNAFVETWINYWHIEPLLKVGDKVKFTHGFKELVSTIESAIDQYWPGRYIMAAQPGESSRPIVRWEDVQAVES